MQQNYQTTKLPTAASQIPSKFGAVWQNPTRIITDDGSSASLNYFSGGDFGASITGSSFGFNLPPGAVIDGIEVYIDGFNSSCYGGVSIGIAGTVAKDIGNLNKSYGSSTDLWGASSITLAQLANIVVLVDTGDVSGGDGYATIDYVSITVFWHIDLQATPADVPVRIAYKVYSRDGDYLGDLPNVSSKFGFSQDINSAGSSIQIICGTYADNVSTVAPLLTEASNIITTENDLDILATETSVVVAAGNSVDNAIFKNSNRVVVYMYNYWYPNGKRMFAGQINRVAFQYGGGNSSVALTVLSDGLDLGNYIARGYPFTYTADVSQTTQNGYVTVIEETRGAWQRYGQTFLTGGTVTNVGAISLMLQGTADVTISLFDGPNGNLIGSVTKNVSVGSPTVTQFEFAQLLTVPSGTSRFFTISLGSGQSINVYYNTTTVYSNGSLHSSFFSGTYGGSYSAINGDLYFITKYGTPTTTTTYTAQDPITGIATGVLADYNGRGGYIKKHSFTAAGYNITYTFNMANVFEAIKKCIELAPAGYYSYIDLGNAKIDILSTSSTADFTVMRSKDINQLTIAMSIEQVKNYLLLTGGESGGVNLFRQYQDTESTSMYGIRTGTKTDNRLTIAATADAIGNSFMAENSDEVQETTVTILNEKADITLFTPGKTIGFRNFGNFIDNLVLQIVRRDFTPDSVILTLGRLPITMSAEMQRINRDLLNEQTVKNPAQPS